MSTKERPPRIGGPEYITARPYATAVFNCNYAQDDGHKIGDYDNPWRVAGSEAWGAFPTHAEAIAYAFKEAGK